MHVNNFKILQCLIDNKCQEPICQIKGKFLREHYVAHYWAKEENREVQCCNQQSDTVYSNQVFYTKLENADNFYDVYKGMNLPTIQNYDAPIDLVFHDCSDYATTDFSSGNSSNNDDDGVSENNQDLSIPIRSYSSSPDVIIDLTMSD